MEKLETATFVAATFLYVILLSLSAWAEESLPHPDTYLPAASEAKKIYRIVDDPRDLMVTYPPKEILPPEIWEYLVVDVEEVKRLTAEIVGFKSPDLVGEIAPEIKPGKYTHHDLERLPGLKELFPPELRLHIKAAGPPLPCSIEEFEIIPTIQLYWYMRLCETTQRNLGKTKLDRDGYIVPRSWQGGYPFPRPSGPLKAQQVYYSFEKGAQTFDLCYGLRGEGLGVDRNLAVDKHAQYEANFTRLMGRTLLPPFGWFDKRAEKRGEFSAFGNIQYEPRANRGTAILRLHYDDPEKMDPMMIFIPTLRRIRKMSATDTQDPLGDITFDDLNHCTQKITPTKYPYKFDIIAEREYLMPIAVNTGKAWIDSKNSYELREVQFMRRPCYVLQMTQLDKNYVYGKRIIYLDKENFFCQLSANYDQRGRLYRSQMYTHIYMPEIALLNAFGTHTLQFDHIDLHSTFQVQFGLPAAFQRKDISMQELVKKGK